MSFELRVRWWHFTAAALFFVFLLVLSPYYIMQAQDSEPRAATVVNTQATVQLHRGETPTAITVPRDAVYVIGAGDQLITNIYGRAIIRFEESLDVMVMPNTRIKIITLEAVGDVVQARISVDGHVLVADPDPGSNVQITIDTDFFIVRPTRTVGIWANFEGGDVITTDEAEVPFERRDSGESGVLNPGEGLYVNKDETHVVQMRDSTLFLHAAQLVGVLFGCPARIVRTGGLNLNLRVAPGLDSTVIGYGEEDAPVRVMGMSTGGNWYRVQRFSGFGWMRQIYLDGDCPNLYTYPVTAGERNLGLHSVQPREQEIMEPFYGTPETNLWIYLSFRPSPYATETAEPTP